MIEIIQHRLRQFGQVDLHHEHPQALHIALAQGRGSRVVVPAAWIAACWSIRGGLWLQSGEREWQLDAGQCQLWGDGVLHCRSSQARGWLLIAGPRQAWPAVAEHGAGQALMLPWQGRVSRDLAHHLIAATRVCRDAAGKADAVAALSVAEGIAHWQSDLHRLLERCAGRTRALRQQTMTRLLRVRHAIFCHPGQRLDLEQLARLANYSPCHLLRMHRRVFGETPFEYASRLRGRQALALVRDTGMSILEISLRLGFENQSAFCRAFKASFGATPTDIRRHAPRQAQRAA